MKYEDSIQFAKKMDREDPLKEYRAKFHLPKQKDKKLVYFSGNSLGLQPKTAKASVKQEMNDWASLALMGYTKARRPWMNFYKLAKKALSQLVGANVSEVIAMNQLTLNIHLMMVSFYRPTKERYKIIMEAGAFPSDQYAVETQFKFHGLDMDDACVEVAPREGEHTIRTEDLVETIRMHGKSVALVFIGGVQYYSGQFFDIKTITAAAHEVGALAGFDLAHAVGNVPLSLHNDGVDFAIWCSYKYLNAGPGAIAGAYIHEKHSRDKSIPRFAGWWGYEEAKRFEMKKGFVPMEGVDGWQLSNTSILQAAVLQSSLEIFKQAGIKTLRKKSELLTGFLEYLLKETDPDEQHYKIITPSSPLERGCQLSIFMKTSGKQIHDGVLKAGIMADWREPNVIRVAPVPLYNTFQEVYAFILVFRKLLKKYNSR